MRLHMVQRSVLSIALAAVLLAAVEQTAQASPSGTNHLIPGGKTAGNGVTVLCYNATGFTCATAGYNGTSGQIGGNGWSTSQYWAYGSPTASGARHNCTTYAAYRLQQDGYHYPGWTDNATNWDTRAWNASPQVVVDQTPVVGSIAQWNHSTGHVAYVEAVTSSYIETTSDNYGGGTDHLRIALISPYRPDNYIHFIKPTASVAEARNKDGRLEIFSVGTDGQVYHKWQTSPGGQWSGWYSLGGNVSPSVAAETNADGRIEIQVVGGDGQIYHKWQTSPGGSWSGWSSLGGHLSL